MPEINNQSYEKTMVADIEVRAVTNFQILPDNGGFNLVLGTRRLVTDDGPHGLMPDFKVEVFAAAYLSHFMMKDLARVLNAAINDFESQVGAIAFPDVNSISRSRDEEQKQQQNND